MRDDKTFDNRFFAVYTECMLNLSSMKNTNFVSLFGAGIIIFLVAGMFSQAPTPETDAQRGPWPSRFDPTTVYEYEQNTAISIGNRECWGINTPEGAKCRDTLRVVRDGTEYTCTGYAFRDGFYCPRRLNNWIGGWYRF